MTKTQQVLEIAKQVEDKVGTLTTITNLKQCLDECDVAYLDESEWEELVSYLERYYIIPNKSYLYGVIESYLEDTQQF
jgi:hypothetical protein